MRLPLRKRLIDFAYALIPFKDASGQSLTAELVSGIRINWERSVNRTRPIPREVFLAQGDLTAIQHP